MESLLNLIQHLATLSAPIIIAFTGVIMFFSSKNASEEFLIGARTGFTTCIKLLPSLVLLIVGVHMFSASGALEMICDIFSPFARIFGVPSEIIPVIVMRPISGSGTTAMMQKLLSDISPDSFAGRCASIIMGSSDTIIYTLAMYFGSVGIKNTRHALPAAFIILAFCVLLSVKLANVF